MKKLLFIFSLFLGVTSLMNAEKCQDCPYTKINCEECCKAKTGVTRECCAACNNCMLGDDGGRSECKDFPS